MDFFNICPTKQYPSRVKVRCNGVAGKRPIWESWETDRPEMKSVDSPSDEEMTYRQCIGMGLVCRSLPYDEILCESFIFPWSNDFKLRGSPKYIEVQKIGDTMVFTALNGLKLSIQAFTQTGIDIRAI